jgi:hypothetical protein
MPVTPFHLLAATPIKAVFPNKFSWSVFCLTNILIDLEPITCFLITLEPRHMFFHTIIGATLVGVIAATHGRKYCEMAIGIWNEELKGNLERKWLTFDRHISKTGAWAGALIGAWSHLLLDSIMHYDIKPLSPFTDENKLLNFINLDWLHAICLGLGVFGFMWILLNKTRK